MQRDYKLDNLRLFLMFCVIVGHMLELFPDVPGIVFLYKVLYSFHMPAFVFLSGWFSRPGRSRRTGQYLMLYLIFQTGYLLLVHALAGDGDRLVLQYTTPYWLMWYLLALVFYQLIRPLLETENPKTMGMILAFSLALSVLAGYDSTVGYYMTLSRFLVFLPYFVLGVYVPKWLKRAKVRRVFSHRVLWAAVCAAGVLAGMAYMKWTELPAKMLYGSYSYAAAGGGTLTRLFFFVVAMSWIGLLLNLMPSAGIPVLTTAGQNTLPVFLLHGFVIKGVIARYLPDAPLLRTTAGALGFAALSAAVLIALLGNPRDGKGFQTDFSVVSRRQAPA